MFFSTQVTQGQYQIKDVRAGSPAEQIGFKSGDLVLSANGNDMTQHIDAAGGPLPSTFPLKQQSQASIGKTFTAEVLRHGDKGQEQKVILNGVIPLDANPDAPLGVSLGLLAIKAERIPYSVDQAMGKALMDIGYTAVTMVRVPLELIRGSMSIEQARPTGVVGITN